jgi:hypothetical protein
MTTNPISLRFSPEEKYVLELLSKKSNMTLSQFIKSQLNPIIKPKLAKVNKTTMLLSKLEKYSINIQDLDKAEAVGMEMRKNFKITLTR